MVVRHAWHRSRRNARACRQISGSCLEKYRVRCPRSGKRNGFYADFPGRRFRTSSPLFRHIVPVAIISTWCTVRQSSMSIEIQAVNLTDLPFEPGMNRADQSILVESEPEDGIADGRIK